MCIAIVEHTSFGCERLASLASAFTHLDQAKLHTHKYILKMADGGEGTFGFKNKFFHFQGETLDGKPDGPGLLRLSNGVTVQGEFVKGELKGPGTKRWPDGSIFYGTFENGEPHGFGRHFSVTNLQDFEGYYERGYKKGLGTLTDHAQGTVFKGDFNRDFPNGKGILTAIGGDLTSPLCVKGYWENGKLHGLSMATMQNGDTVVGMCEGGLWTGNGSFTTQGHDGLLQTPEGEVEEHEEPNDTLGQPSMRITYKGPLAEGKRAEVPDCLKLRSAVLLYNRAPLEKTDPDKPGDGMLLWGAKPSTGKMRGIPRSPNKNDGLSTGRVGGNSTTRTPRADNKNGRQLSPALSADANPTTLLVTAPCLTPLRLQVALATKSYKTIALADDPRVSITSATGGPSVSSGRNSVTPTVTSLTTSGTNGRTASGVGALRDLKAAKDSKVTSKKGKKGKKGTEDAESPAVPTFVTEEVLTVQRSESGRPLFARLYSIRGHMAGSKTAEDWAVANVQDELTRRFKSNGLGHPNPFTLDPAELERDGENDEDDNGEDGADDSDEGYLDDGTTRGVTPAESNFAPMSVATKSSGSSPSTTPRQTALAKRSKAGDLKDKSFSPRPTGGSALTSARGGFNSTTNSKGNVQQPPTKSEMLLSLMRYLTPVSKRDALEAKSLPAGIVEAVFGVGGTPPQLSPRTRPSTSPQLSPRLLTPGAAPLFPPPSKDDLKSDHAHGNQFHSSRPHSAAGFTDGGGAVSRTATNTQKTQHYEFPTKEELCSVCSDGTASFEFFLPAEGEYLLEIFVCGDVQLSPGNESLKRELASSLFVPFLSVGANFSSARHDDALSGVEEAEEESDGEG